MTRRIVLAVVGVTTVAIIGFGTPLAFLIQRAYQEEAARRLEREAAAATTEVPTHFRRAGDRVELPSDPDIRYGLYLRSGRRVQGAGPAPGDPVVRRAVRRGISDQRTGATLVVAAPVSVNEQVIAVVRAEERTDATQDRIQRAWAGMTVLAALIVAVAAALAWGLAGRLNRPVRRLADAISDLGAGDFSVRVEPSGIAELDRAGDAVGATAQRLGSVLERERAFSADASHQLRTPLTALRLHLAEAAADPEVAAQSLGAASADADRLQRTIEDLLSLARDVTPARPDTDLAALFADLAQAWGPRLATDERVLEVHLDADLGPVRTSEPAVRQILDVLVGNAAEHGAGPVTITARDVGGATVIDVHDEGPGVDGDVDAIFLRRTSERQGHGIGLALARSLAEAEGGRLLLRGPGPSPTFSLLLPEAGEP